MRSSPWRAGGIDTVIPRHNNFAMRRSLLLLFFWSLTLAPAIAAQQNPMLGMGLIAVGTSEEAQDIRNRLLAGETFTELAQKHSVDLSSDAGGYLGRTAITELPLEAQPVVAGMQPGELSPVIRSGDRYLLVTLLSEEETDIVEFTPAWEQQMILADRAYQQARYADAEQAWLAALEIANKIFVSDPRLPETMSNLARLYRIQAKYDKAEPFYRNALGLFETILGPQDGYVATALTNLGYFYMAVGKYSDAEEVFKRSLSIDETNLGPNDPELISTLDAMAHTYTSQKRYDEADATIKREMAIASGAGLPDYPLVSRSLVNLARLHLERQDYIEAEPLFRWAFDIVENAVGSNHPELQSSITGLAGVYSAQGKYSEAEVLYKSAMEIVEPALGADHPDMAAILTDLAECYRAQTRYAEAEPLYKRSLNIMEGALGQESPELIPILNNLALLYDAEGRQPEVEASVKRALNIGKSDESLLKTIRDNFPAIN